MARLEVQAVLRERSAYELDGLVELAGTTKSLGATKIGSWRHLALDEPLAFPPQEDEGARLDPLIW